MKKMIIACALSLSSLGALAATGNVCSGGAAAAGTVADTASDFAVTAINIRCSQNVFLSFSDSATAIGVGAGSAKGKTAYKGNSAGGAIVKDSDCAATGCTQDKASTAAGNGLTDAAGTGGTGG